MTIYNKIKNKNIKKTYKSRYNKRMELLRLCNHHKINMNKYIIQINKARIYSINKRIII